MYISRKFMKIRAEETHELEGVWREGNLKSGLQEDSCNCGPFVLMVRYLIDDSKGFNIIC